MWPASIEQRIPNNRWSKIAVASGSGCYPMRYFGTVETAARFVVMRDELHATIFVPRCILNMVSLLEQRQAFLQRLL